jgi:two-component system, OmpR family, sensor histidine kinase BaeS
VLFAIAVNVGGAAALWVVRGITGALAWPLAWPLSVAALVLCTAGVFVLAMRRIGSPLSEIVLAARRVGDGDYSVRLAEEGLPWLRSVAAAFNAMTARLDRQQRERRALFADIAHELRTPVAIIQGRVEGMLDGVYPRDEPHVRQVLEDTRMLARLIEDLRTSAHAESGTLSLERDNIDPGSLIDEVTQAFAAEAERRGVRIEPLVAAALPMMNVDPHRIREVLSNLLANALRHAPTGSVVSLECDQLPGSMVVRVSDRGPGIPPADLSQVFERFHKGADSPGSGLGLSIARSLVGAHGGTLVAATRPGGGTVMTVVLPLQP